MIKIKEATGVKRNSFVVLNGVGTSMYSTDNEFDLQEWYDQNHKTPLAWSYQYRYFDCDGIMHEVECTPS